jgi:hypothetical protein
MYFLTYFSFYIKRPISNSLYKTPKGNNHRYRLRRALPDELVQNKLNKENEVNLSHLGLLVQHCNSVALYQDVNQYYMF